MVATETIKFPAPFIASPKFIELPLGDWLLASIPLSKDRVQFQVYSQSEKIWKTNIPQNAARNVDALKNYMPLSGLALYLNHKGDLVLTFNHDSPKKENSIYIIESHDYGKSWIAPRLISPEDCNWLNLNNPILIEEGAFFGHTILPVEDMNSQRPLILYTEDNGKSWNFSLFIEPYGDNGEDQPVADENLTVSSHPVVLEKKSGNIEVIFQRNGSNKLFSTDSHDLGAVWSDPTEISLPNCENIIHFDALRLKDTHDQYTEQRIIFVAVKSDGLIQMTLWRSTNDGSTYQEFWTDALPEIHEDLYCQCYQDKQGRIHLLYNLNDLEIRHIWLDNDMFLK